MNIIVYKGEFSYGVVNYFSDELFRAFSAMGHNVEIVDVWEKKNELARNKGTDMVLAFNVIGAIGDNKIYDNMNTVFGALLVDHPFYHYNRIQRIKAKQTFFSVLDEGTIETAEKYIKSDGIYTHLMHGGSYAQGKYSDRKYDVVFVGGLTDDYSKIDDKIKGIPEGSIRNIAIRLYEKACKEYCKTLDMHMEEILSSMDFTDELLGKEKFGYIIAYIYSIVDKAIRSRLRYNAVLSLLKSGMTVHFYGNCQVSQLGSYDNFINHGPVDYQEILEVMAQAKIVINDLPYFKNGSHERVFSAMLNGALIISNTNNYSYNMYKDGESIIFYDVNDQKDYVDKVKYYLANENERSRIAENAYKITSEYNTWENRANEILEIYNVVKSI